MLVSVSDLIWGAIALATLALIVTLVAVGLELRSVLRVLGTFAASVEREASPMLQDLQHIMQRLDAVSEVVEDKVEQTSQLVDKVEESLAAGRVRAQDVWEDTREWLSSLKVGWQAGMEVFRNGGDGRPAPVAEPSPEPTVIAIAPSAPEALPVAEDGPVVPGMAPVPPALAALGEPAAVECPPPAC